MNRDQWGFFRWAHPRHFERTLVCGYCQLADHRTITRWIDKAGQFASLPRFGTSSVKNHISSSTVLIRLFNNVYQRRNKEVCSISAMSLHAEDISVPAKSQRMSYKVDFISPLCSKTPSIFQVISKLLKDWEDFEARHDALRPDFWSQNFWYWGINFMGPFSNSFGYQFILITMDYISKWVEVVPTKTNDNKVVVKFLKENIFSHFGIPRQ